MALLLAFGTVLPTEIIRAEKESRSEKEPVPATPENLDQGLIWAHVSRAMDADDNPNKVFVRWEEPVRYYLQGLEEYPAFEHQFKKQVANIRRITGLDIKRHPAVYLAYKDPKKRETGRDGYSTDAALFFTKTMKNGFQEPYVRKIISAFGDDPYETYKFWKTKKGHKELGFVKYGYDRKGLSFYLLVEESRKYWKKNKLTNRKKREISLLALGLVRKSAKNSNIIKSILNDPSKKTYELTAFDKAFLQAYYSDLVRSGMGNREAALKITEALTKRFKKKAGDE